MDEGGFGERGFGWLLVMGVLEMGMILRNYYRVDGGQSSLLAFWMGWHVEVCL